MRLSPGTYKRCCAIVPPLLAFAPLAWYIELWSERYPLPFDVQAFLQTELPTLAVLLAAPVCLFILSQRD